MLELFTAVGHQVSSTRFRQCQLVRATGMGDLVKPHHDQTLGRWPYSSTFQNKTIFPLRWDIIKPTPKAAETKRGWHRCMGILGGPYTKWPAEE